MKLILFLFFIGSSIFSFSQDKEMKSNPEVCINFSCNGQTIKKSVFEYGGYIKLMDSASDYWENFTVLSWEILANGRKYKGEGKDFDEYTRKMLRDPSVKKIAISVSAIHDESQTKFKREAQFDLR